MIRGNFLSSEQRAHLVAVVRRPSEKHGVGRRANAILLLDDGWTCEEVARALYLDDDTVRGWHGRFHRGGVLALAVFGWKGSARRFAARGGSRTGRDSIVQAFPDRRRRSWLTWRGWGSSIPSRNDQAVASAGIRLPQAQGVAGQADGRHRRLSSPPMRRCSTGLEPTRSFISPMPSTPNIRAGRRMAGSGAASISPSGAARVGNG